ncbi:sodium pump decarboxylase [Brachyspira hampsonii]|uniref:Sodium pump decarboxylase n=1 Tax=Brachyspira hampsonii TaxID=1287055 RepID=A0A1E5NDK9_9SPIR|nr:OadG family protein [Brachyspira hampsonii]OEJ14236.1 sodium pump decarboxylase [Brachyspira hampsonii]
MNSSIIEALQIMIIGMAVVVLFLIILVFVMKIVGAVVAKVDKLMPPQEAISSSPAPVQTSNNDKMVAIAIALAHVHSNKK